MRNPWLEIPLADYEAHMSLPQVGQAQLLADVFASGLEAYKPRSVAVLGCAGGNGFDRISSAITERVVGVDLNSDYVDAARARFSSRFRSIELFVGDLERDTFTFSPVDLVFAGLVLEYVDLNAALHRMSLMLRLRGILITVIQLPGDDVPEVTPSRFTSLSALSSVMRLVSPDKLQRLAAAQGFQQIDWRVATASGGKRFQVQTFQRSDENENPQAINS